MFRDICTYQCSNPSCMNSWTAPQLDYPPNCPKCKSPASDQSQLRKENAPRV